MTSNEQLELLMQRAADGELSTEQRRRLIEAMEQDPSRWKQLACTFLEEQLVGRTIREGPVAPADPEQTIVRPARRLSGFWYHHPALTSAITLCLAFVLGLAVPWSQPVVSPVSRSVQMNTQPVLTEPVGTGAAARSDTEEAELRSQVSRILRILEGSQRRASVPADR